MLSQWDDRPVQSTIRQWREDTGSVLVGTKTLTTGVDAPGDTCTLVVLDRVPRVPSNPVDDARVKDLQTRCDYDRWTADRYVYYDDAYLVLQQAVGRLIRGVDDHGMVAILDPRLVKGAHAYNAFTRSMLIKAVDGWGYRTTDLSDASTWLEANRGVSTGRI